MREKVLVVGGGPSLFGFDFNRLRNHDTIVVNDSVFCTPSPTYFITMDYTWLFKHHIQYGKIQGQKDTAFFNRNMRRFFLVSFGGDRLGIIEHGVEDKLHGVKYDLRPFDRVIYTSGYGGFGGTFDNFRSGSDSGYAAIQLAAALGYKQICLLGLDFAVEDATSTITGMPGATVRTTHGMYRPLTTAVKLETRTHFHTKAPRSRGNELKAKLDEFLTPYPEMLAQAHASGLTILSCSKISKLNRWIPYAEIGKVL